MESEYIHGLLESRQQDVHTRPKIPQYRSVTRRMPETLIEESYNLARHVFSSRLLVIHDAGGSRHDDEAELTRREELDDPFLEIRNADVVAGRDDASLVEPSWK